MGEQEMPLDTGVLTDDRWVRKVIIISNHLPPTGRPSFTLKKKDIFWIGKWTTCAIGLWPLRVLLCRSANSGVQHACPLVVLSQPGSGRCAGLAPPISSLASSPNVAQAQGRLEPGKGALSWWTDPVAFFVVALRAGKRREKDVGGVWEAEARIRSQ